MKVTLADLVFFAGFAQLSVLIASALVPIRLEWRKQFMALRRLHRQLYWVYGGYVVLAIISNGLICLFHANEIAEGGGLARGFCIYVAFFWGIRLSLQAILDVKEYLTAWWLKAGYHILTLFFASFTALFAYAALR